MKIGIAITTRRRHDVLAFALRHFMRFNDNNHTFAIVVSDDNPSPLEAEANDRLCCAHGAAYLPSNKRLGIAKNKNVGIHFLRNLGADHFFLFDDDAFPCTPNWYQPFIDLARSDGIEHSMVCREIGGIKVTESNERLTRFDQCQGYCLYFTAHAMGHLKGMDPAFGIYGYEHCELSRRAAEQNFCKGYVMPTLAADRIYSIDMDHGWLGKESPLGPMPGAFHSSVEGERPLIADWIEEGRQIYCRPSDVS